MAENELITPMMAAYFDVPADALARTIGSENMEAEGVAMSRVLAVVRSHDAARVPADAELDGLVAWLSSRQTCTGFASPEPHVLETVYAPCEKSQSAADAITALRRRVAELEAERDKLQDANMWRPIEAAPTEVEILIIRDDGSMDLISAAENDSVWQPYRGPFGPGIAAVTHWRPLPAPPSDAQEGRADG